jgi:undecaprenyl pyrophosphate synthase
MSGVTPSRASPSVDQQHRQLQAPRDVVGIHLGIIPDGNRRWAALRGVEHDVTTMVARHLAGVCALLAQSDAFEASVAAKLGIHIQELTIYTMSHDNMTKRNDQTRPIIYTFLTMILIASTVHRSVAEQGILWMAPQEKACKDRSPIRVTVTGSTLTRFFSEASERCGGSVALSIASPATGKLLSLLGVALRVSDAALTALPLDLKNAMQILASNVEPESTAPYCQVEVVDGGDSCAPIVVTGAPPYSDARFDALTTFLRSIKLNVLGETHLLPQPVKSIVGALCTAFDPDGNNTDGTRRVRVLRLALAYDPILDMARQMTHTTTIPDIDLVIRTSGEVRTSGFLPVQTLYSEWVFQKKLFPEYGLSDLCKALKLYKARQRRRGG